MGLRLAAAALLCAVICAVAPGCQANGAEAVVVPSAWGYSYPDWWKYYAAKYYEAKKPVVEYTYAPVAAKKKTPVTVVVASPAPLPVPAPVPVPSPAAAATANAQAAATTAPPTATPPGACTTVAAAAKANPNLSILATAVQAAGLASTLDDPNLVATIFAPTNDGEAQADSAYATQLTLGLTPEAALAPANIGVIKTLLSTHVVPGVAAKSTTLTNGQALPTLNSGENLTVDLTTPGTVLIKPSLGQAAKVVQPDIAACKAIVHVIDRVLLPSNALPTGAPAGK
ncbi:hypothetical protein N2152v2_007137 [Parachlorella kessleri]